MLSTAIANALGEKYKEHISYCLESLVMYFGHDDVDCMKLVDGTVRDFLKNRAVKQGKPPYLFDLIHNYTNKRIKTVADEISIVNNSLGKQRTYMERFFGTLHSEELKQVEGGQMLISKFGIFGLQSEKALYVRECYIQLYDKIITTFAEDKPPNSIIVMGTPGIGKSFFEVYFLFRIIHDIPNRLVIHSYQRKCAHLYVNGESAKLEEAATAFGFNIQANSLWKGSIDMNHPNSKKLMEFLLDDCNTYYLIDEDDRFEERPPKARIVVFTSPCRKRFSRVRKHEYVEYFMPVWSLKELQTALFLLVAAGQNFQGDLETRFHRRGGIPRYLFWTEEQDAQDLENALNLTNPEKIKMALDPFTEFSEISSRLVHIEVTSSFGYSRMVPASSYVQRELIRRLISSSNFQTKILLNTHGQSFGSVRGVMREMLWHRVIHGGNKEFKLKSLDATRNDYPPTFCLPNSIQVKTFVRKDMKDLRDLNVNEYALPQIDNFESLDSFIILKDPFKTGEGNVLIGFQMTLTLQHPVKGPGLQTIMKKVENIASPNCSVYLIFVIPLENLEGFTKQKIITKNGDEYKRDQQWLGRVKQLAIGVDDKLEAFI